MDKMNASRTKIKGTMPAKRILPVYVGYIVEKEGGGTSSFFILFSSYRSGFVREDSKY